MDDLDRLHQRLLDAVRESAPHLRERRFRLGDIPQHLLPYRLHRRELGFESVQQYERALARLAAGERGYLAADASVHETFRRLVEGNSGAPLDQALRLYADAQVSLSPASRARPETPAAGAPHASAPHASAPGAAPVPAAVDPHTAELPVPDGIGRGASPAGAAVGDAVTGEHPVVAPDAARATPALELPIVRVGAEAPTVAIPIPRGPEPSPSAMPFPVRPPAQVVGGTCPHCARPLPAERGVTFCPYCGENLTVRRCPACSTELDAGWRFCITCGRQVDDPTAAAPV
jgi:predicted RNA-binding Zn-ribbon protein involved in translation (DUF1610 family)